jgi:hypothetical protein
MRIAVLYTGALRTIRKTISYFKKNVLLGHHVFVFACLQNDSTSTDSEMESWLRTEMTSHLTNLRWFTLEDYSEWIIHREKNLDATTIPAKWKDYLRNSGSMLEYLQLHLSFKDMYHYEEVHGMSFDYIVKMRPDNIFAKPIDFHWLSWSVFDIQARIELIKQHMEQHNLIIHPQRILEYFMNTILDDQLIPHLDKQIGQFIPNTSMRIPLEPLEYYDYLHYGCYILTFRTNNLYIVRRNLFHLIPSLFSMYGLLRLDPHDPYWFNAENQFQYACLASGLAIHDYNTLFEDKSLYEYDESRYFDEQYRIKHPTMVYCLVRN